MTKVTLRIIAEETGLSKFAVSRALAGKEGVSETTRRRVQDAADRLGYTRPSRTFQKTIGTIFDEADHINSEMNVQIQNGLQSEAQRLGYSIRAHWMSGEANLGSFLDSCAALLVVNVQRQSTLAKIRACGKPVVYGGWVDPLEQVDAVGGTDHEAGVAVGRYLHGLGHREIVYVRGDVDLLGRRRRLHGLEEVVSATPGMRAYNLTWDEHTTFTSELDKIIANGGRPTAFFCGHDNLALAAYTDLLSRGLRIPSDVSVVGFGDCSAAHQVSPALTTVQIRGQEYGRVAVRRLDRRLRNPEASWVPLRMLVPNVLIERGSVGPLNPAGINLAVSKTS
ncbi:LacI family DNA-binding transcriptional regulator [Pseudoruegeria sp. SK021]|uniref:LacI family DNA-binding transcriptional regulator n=1 Tax=Pseudoruegeria sp. SK021 TaxID=1933035 RepID=UPI000A3218AC|nr:LacI family DNA-binding transcriptional regulator [Pseudoruegeria sp. SK021]